MTLKKKYPGSTKSLIGLAHPSSSRFIARRTRPRVRASRRNYQKVSKMSQTLSKSHSTCDSATKIIYHQPEAFHFLDKYIKMKNEVPSTTHGCDYLAGHQDP